MKNLNILLVEDDTIEVMKLKRATESLKLQHRIMQASNGEEALQLLQDKSEKNNFFHLHPNLDCAIVKLTIKKVGKNPPKEN